ncbi:hypothetical protein RhiJN_24050 [Ceratobasidium sp. AG-Ba]|nr:hypothetical protein RhiJN_24050 [Ceratobasidium sp. AG-Ba]
MSIQAGTYSLRSVLDPTIFVGTGAVPAIYPPYPAPLRSIEAAYKDAINIQPTTGGYYVLKAHGQFIGYNGTDVKLLPLGGTAVEWAIVEVNGTDVYRLELPNQGKWWMTSGVKYTTIQLVDDDESLSEEWSILPYKF